MKPLPLALGAATLVAFATLTGLAIYGEVLFRDVPSLFLHTGWLTKVAIFLSLALIGWAALAPNRSGQAYRRLNLMAMLAVGFGVLTTLLEFSNRGMICVDETKADMLKVLGPDHAQNLMPIAFGLLAATVATARAGKAPPAR